MSSGWIDRTTVQTMMAERADPPFDPRKVSSREEKKKKSR